jgi:hypothetical protein
MATNHSAANTVPQFRFRVCAGIFSPVAPLYFCSYGIGCGTILPRTTSTILPPVSGTILPPKRVILQALKGVHRSIPIPGTLLECERLHKKQYAERSTLRLTARMLGLGQYGPIWSREPLSANGNRPASTGHAPSPKIGQRFNLQGGQSRISPGVAPFYRSLPLREAKFCVVPGSAKLTTATGNARRFQNGGSR